MHENIRPQEMERIINQKLANEFIETKISELKDAVGDSHVILALSGGVDSLVVAALLDRAVDEQLTCIHVNTGLMRKNESESVVEHFNKTFKAKLIYVDASDRFLDKLSGVSDPERKRKIIGAEFINVFAEEARKLTNVSFLAQGTIYPDIVESVSLKSHHNVGGLPDDLEFELIEPIKFLYKDEVRQVGLALGLPEHLVFRQPFPGPGLGVRCTGAITRERLSCVRESDAILREEFYKAGLDKEIWQYFTVVPDIMSTGVIDGSRTDSYPVIIRAVKSVDATEASVWAPKWEILSKITERILNEVKGVNRVLYDMSPKPPATIEWE